ncbi:MAG TPA: hypothetical protein VM030_05760 [Acidimicrobiales bacterium]|nr:hypothetical protein [Acidimicrobiales bacterium]
MRPPTDPAKLLGEWAQFESGNVLPGRLLADLKKGGLRELLEVASAPAALLDPWMQWEKGRVSPQDTIAALTAGGLTSFLESLSDPKV